MSTRHIDAPLPKIIPFPSPPAFSDEAPLTSSSNSPGNGNLSVLQKEMYGVTMLMHHEDTLHLRIPTSLDPAATDHEIVYSVMDAGSSGKGLYSNTHSNTQIGLGDVILLEKPLIIYPQLLPYHSTSAPHNAYPELDDALSHMPDEHRVAFFELANSHPEEPSVAKGIIDTNALHLGILPGTTSSHQYAAVCKDLSRANHSCSPNALYRFDRRTFCFELRVLLPIPAGEQIFISYIDPALSRAERQASLLADYGFRCACWACADPNPTPSDTRRGLIARGDAHRRQRDAGLERWATSVSSGTMDEPDGGATDRMIANFFEAERLYYELAWEGVVTRLCKACCARGDEEGARKWAGLAAGLYRAYWGYDPGWAEIEAAPERTEWWGLKRKVSMS